MNFWVNPRHLCVHLASSWEKRERAGWEGGRERESGKGTSLRWAGSSDLTSEGKEAPAPVYLVASAFTPLSISSL